MEKFRRMVCALVDTCHMIIQQNITLPILYKIRTCVKDMSVFFPKFVSIVNNTCKYRKKHECNRFD